MKKILIVPSNTDLNRGDQSLTWASITIAKEVFKDNVSIFLYKTKGKLADKTKTNHQTEKLGYPLLTRILSHPRRDDTGNEVNFSKLILVKWGFRALFDLIGTFMLLSRFSFLNKLGCKFLSEEQKHTYHAFKSLDGLFVKGGGFLHSYGSLVDPYIMYFQLFDVFLARKYKIPVFILPNSIGPLRNGLARKIVISALRYAKVIYVRESTSLEFLKTLNIPAIKSPDFGFYLKPSERNFESYLKEKGVPIGEKKCIAITLRPYRFDGNQNADELYHNYLNEIKKFIQSSLSNNTSVTLLAHTIGPSAHEDDRIPLMEIYQDMPAHNDLIFLHDRDLNSEDLEKIYSYYDLVVGTRFHSVIFALNVKTPAIAIAYGGNKAVGIMNDMELNDFVVPIENPDSSKLIDLSTRIFNNNAEYVMKIENYRIKLQHEKNLLIDRIKENYN
jgi:colanic acid/amylovoran biosynthesis protein